MTPVEELRYVILAAQREGNRLLAEALQPLGLGPAQAEVLRVLQDHQPLSLSDLGSLLVCETGSPSRLVNGLVARGMIQRAPALTDGRMVMLRLTDDGIAAADHVAAIEAALYAGISSIVEERQISVLLPALRQLVAGRRAGEALTRRIQLNAQKAVEETR